MQQSRQWMASKAYFKAIDSLYGSTIGEGIGKEEKPLKSKISRVKTNVPTERKEGLVLVGYADARNLPLVHTPNEGRRTLWQGAALKAQGLRAGYPDYTLYIAKNGYHGLMIELKRKKGGVTSDKQKYWIDLLNRNGYLAIICRGADEAIKAIEDYLK